MKALAAVLLTLLLCGQQASVSSSVKWTGHPDGYGPAAVKGQRTTPSVAGRGRAQEVEEYDVDSGPEGYDEEDDEEDDEASVTAGGRGTGMRAANACRAASSPRRAKPSSPTGILSQVPGPPTRGGVQTRVSPSAGRWTDP
ncbi:glycosylphosphatidylinositol-anchored high density lipoprotein-binding protein 1 isoform X6 [Kogia breviceps]|uniref:glycosylphosphatidylinositol-anchored high density lipoprotein-binding protein 1 isoform X6 n=1 Tax=Kogia breviceps TaxID=27615 RepID=UPI0034D32F10